MAKRKRPPTTPPVDHHTKRMAEGDEPADTSEGRPRTRVKNPNLSKPKGRTSKLVRIWEPRLTRSNKVYEAWDKKFQCQRLDEYYEGQQWRGHTDDEAQLKYVINMVFATIETQLPTLLFSKPKVNVEARPDHQQTDQSKAGARATLIEQTLQTFIDDPKLAFNAETTLALRDAYARFGVVEVGYTADFIDNPNVGKPMLREDGKSPMLDGDGGVLMEPKKILAPKTKESLFVRRLPAWCCRVGASNHNRLVVNDWFAFYEWHQVEDVKANKNYQNTEDLQETGTHITDTSTETEPESEDADGVPRRMGMVKIWKIYDLRLKVRHVLADGHRLPLQKNQKFKYLPFAVLKFFERKDAFYPLPPIYNWLSPQDEINETREMQKVHRRRALRRYMHEPGITIPEREKLQSSEDMLFIEVPTLAGAPPIQPIQDAPLDAQNWTDLAQTHLDLNLISGTTGEQRNQPTAPTATQANISNTRATQRESATREVVAAWLGDIARLMLLTIRDRMTLPFMVKRSMDPFAMMANPKEVGEKAQLWQQVESEDIDDLDVDVKIDVASLSPVAKEAQRQNWLQVLALLGTPGFNAMVMQPNPDAPDDPSPMLRKTLDLCDITSDQEIREIWRVGQALLEATAEATRSQAALAKQPEPPKVSLALKGEDIAMFLGLDAPAYIRSLLGLQPAADAADIAVATPAVADPNATQPPVMPEQPGQATGIPAGAPA